MSVPRYIYEKYSKSVADLGRNALSTLYPSDFELYLVALELVDSQGITEEYFVFPIMPSQIQKVENNRTNVKKSSSGTTILYSDSFTPNDLSIKGNFGRGFKFLVKQDKDLTAFGVGFNFGKLAVKTPNFDATVKTGFGATKILQRICNNSNKLDSKGNPRRLFFYNMALSEQYLCVVPNGGLTLSQSYESNMIWNYALNLTIVSNMEDLKSSLKQTSSSTLLASSSIQKGITNLTRDLFLFTKGGLNKII